MQFNTIEYLIFLPVVMAVYYLIPYSWRWIWLLTATFFFLSCNPWFIIPLLAVALVEYGMALLIENSKNQNKCRGSAYLIIGIVFPLALLIMYKYVPFFNDAVFKAMQFFHYNYPLTIKNLIVPLGISYYTFQSICYIIAVYNGSVTAERHFGIFTLYLMFFPKFIAGPIERPHLINQFHEHHDLDYRLCTGGLKLIALGLFKKMVVADRVGIVVNEVYNHHDYYHGIYFILATFFFAVQIYSDFSGYTDIARGSAQLLGFRLMENFKRPYGSRSLAEFWRRWHISLSTWFRDYLYIPLGGNRVSRGRLYFNLFITFIISGFWHGANWTFFAWGALHGSYALIGLWTRPIRQKIVGVLGFHDLPNLHKLIQIVCTGLLVLFAWVFFRSGTISIALHILYRIFSGLGDTIISICTGDTDRLKALTDIARGNMILGFSRETYRPEMLIAAASILFLWFFNSLQEHTDIGESLPTKSWVLRWSLYYLMIAGILFFGMFTNEQFIYFRF